MIIAPGTTNVTTYFKLVDPSAGTPETGLTITDLDATYVRDGAAASKSDLTALAAADSAHADNKAYEVDGTNCPGLYRVDWPDAAFAAGVDRVQLCVNGSEIDPAYIEVELLDLASIDANVDAILVDTGTTLDGKINTISTNVDSVLADTGTDGVQVAGLKAAALADMFDTSSGTTYSSAVSGSVVKEIADNAGGSALTSAAIADAVWDEATTGHTTASTFGGELYDVDADVWSYTTRRLTEATSTETSTSSDEITRYRGDTWDIDISGMGDISGRTGEKLYFSVKADKADHDNEAWVKVGETTGLIRINGKAATTAANGSITVTDASAGDITVVVKGTETAKLTPRDDIYYDVQMIDSDGATTLADGTFNVTADVTRATS